MLVVCGCLKLRYVYYHLSLSRPATCYLTFVSTIWRYMPALEFVFKVIVSIAVYSAYIFH